MGTYEGNAVSNVAVAEALQLNSVLDGFGVGDRAADDVDVVLRKAKRKSEESASEQHERQKSRKLKRKILTIPTASATARLVLSPPSSFLPLFLN